ncbi:MAG: site-specific DNA-methyltransferase [Alphaproteobacteria bacterium]|nr:site-specific DNA-methyltransferase [Alphaproteobacteria bacterium]
MSKAKPKPETARAPWPATNIERWSVDRLKPYGQNARTHTDEDVAKVAASIEQFGFTNPILIDEAGEIVAGHCRFRAAQKLNLTIVPVIVARGWSKAQKAAYCIADNQLAARASWDPDLLQQELNRLQANDFDLGLLGFDVADLAQLLSPTTEGLTDPDDVPAVQERAITRPGDTWVLDRRHRVHCGDSTDAAAVAAALGNLSPILMVTDPPYGVDYDPAWRTRNGTRKVATGRVLNDDRADWRAAWAHFKGDVAYVWHGALHADVVAESLRAAGFELRAQIIWAKQHFALSRGDYHWKHEACWYAVRKGAKSRWSGDRKQTTVWEIANNNPFGNSTAPETFGHGTQKPVECMRRPIVNNSVAGDVVYDAFLGTGTTIIASEITARVCVGLELSPPYVDVIVKRWQAFTGHEAVLEATGETFAKRSAAGARVARKTAS